MALRLRGKDGVSKAYGKQAFDLLAERPVKRRHNGEIESHP
jgi:hypothetical protein